MKSEDYDAKFLSPKKRSVSKQDVVTSLPSQELEMKSEMRTYS